MNINFQSRFSAQWNAPFGRVRNARTGVRCVWSSERDGSVCSPECTTDGCWGRGDDHCVTCRRYRHGRLCIASCEQSTGLYTVNGTFECAQCHEQCDDVDHACTGPVSTKYQQPRTYTDELVGWLEFSVLFSAQMRLYQRRIQMGIKEFIYPQNCQTWTSQLMQIPFFGLD